QEIGQQVAELVRARRRLQPRWRQQRQGDAQQPAAGPDAQPQPGLAESAQAHRRRLRSPWAKAQRMSTPRWKPMAWKRSPISPGSISRLISLWRWWRSTGSAIASISARRSARPQLIRKLDWAQ